MLVLISILILMMMMMMKSGAETIIITARSGEPVLLTSDLHSLKPGQDVRWTHHHLVMSLKKKVKTCGHGRCELLRDGSLSFSHIQAVDAGNYNLEVFEEDGRRTVRKDFLLRVDGSSSSSSGGDGGGGSSSVLLSVLICCFLLLLSFILIFIRRRRNQRTLTTGQQHENVYVVMHGLHGNKKKEEEEEKQDESHYVPFNPVASMETPITASVDTDDIYV